MCVQGVVLTGHLGSATQSPPALILQEGLPPSEAPFVYLVKPAGVAVERDDYVVDSCLDPRNILGALLHLLENLTVGKDQQTPHMTFTENERPGGATQP